MRRKRKKKKKSSSLGFHNFSVNYERRGVNLSKLGGANSSFEILNWAFQNVFVELDCFWRKQPNSPGRAGRQPPPPFSYKKAKWGCSKGPRFTVDLLPLFPKQEICFREENSSQGASVTLPRGFRKQICEGFPPFFTVLRPFFISSSFFSG